MVNRACKPTTALTGAMIPGIFNVPEGSYSTDPDGPRRIYELREAVMALYEIGLLVVVDVVYKPYLCLRIA